MNDGNAGNANPQRDFTDDVDRLLITLWHSELRAALGRLRTAATLDKSPIQRINSYTGALIESVYAAEPSRRASLAALVWLGQFTTSRDRSNRLTDELIQPLRDAIRDGCRSGTVSSQNPGADAQAVFHLILGLAAAQAALGASAPREHLERTVTASVRQALGIAAQ